MKILLRQIGTRKYLARINQTVQWSELEEQAYSFPNLESALGLCSSLNLKEMEVVVKYGVAEAESLTLPL